MTRDLHSHASACGKVILLGEHAVVYGYPAIAAGLPNGLSLSATRHADPAKPIHLKIPAWELDLHLDAITHHPVARACCEVLRFCGGPLQGWTITGQTSLPARAGLGSSAALTVAMARLVLGEDAEVDTVMEASLIGERIFHETPSGIDSLVAARGGILRFVRSQEPTPLTPALSIPLMIVPSLLPRSTATQVAKVRRKIERFPNPGQAILSALGAVVDEGMTAIQTGNLADLGEMMSISHELLSALGVSSPRLDQLFHCALEHGALGAKLTGAGGGGCLIALLPPSEASESSEPVMKTAFCQLNLQPFVVNLAHP